MTGVVVTPQSIRTVHELEQVWTRQISLQTKYTLSLVALFSSALASLVLQLPDMVHRVAKGWEHLNAQFHLPVPT